MVTYQKMAARKKTRLGETSFLTTQYPKRPMTNLFNAPVQGISFMGTRNQLPKLNSTPNFFGIKQPKRKGIEVRPLSRYGHSPNSKSKMPKQVSWMGAKDYQRYRIGKSAKRYGDRDFDGSPNYFDCDPRRVDRDGLFSALKKAGAFVKKETVSAGQALSSAGRYVKKETSLAGSKLKRIFTRTKPAVTKQGGYLRESAKPTTKIPPSGRYADMSGQRFPPAETEPAKGPGKYYNPQTVRKTLEKAGRGAKILVTEVPIRTVEAAAPYVIKGKAMMEAVPGQVSSFAKSLGESRADVLNRQLREMAYKRKSGEITKKQFEYAKMRAADEIASMKKEKNVGRITAARIAKVILPAGAKGETGGGIPRGSAGRPVGSIKDRYASFGGVIAYRKWAVKQNQLSRLRGFKVNLPRTLKDQSDLDKVNAYIANTSKEYPGGQQVKQEYKQVIPERTSSYSAGAYTAPGRGRGFEAQQQTEAIEKTQITPELLRKAQQLQAQQTDQILAAPQFMKGELKNVGGDNSMTYTPAELNILNAPNFSQGQMRTLNKDKEIPSVVVGPPPMPNGFEDQYLDIDPVSGKHMLKRRVKEKWLTIGDEYGFNNVNNPARAPLGDLVEAAKARQIQEQMQEAAMQQPTGEQQQDIQEENRPKKSPDELGGKDTYG